MYLKTKVLLKRQAHNSHWKILFTDEKNFVTEKFLNSQNDRKYARTAQEA